MKKIQFMFLTVLSFMYADLSKDQVSQMVAKIHEQREGVKLETLETTKEPFVKLTTENNVTAFVVPKRKEDAKMSLHGIMNGKAYINNTWIGVNDEIMGYTLKYIGKEGVVLRNENQIKKLFLHKERNNLITIEGR